MRAHAEADTGEPTVGVRERFPDIVKRSPDSSGREDDVRLLVLRPDLLIGLSEDGVASCINGEQKQHQGHKTPNLFPPVELVGTARR